MSAERIDWHADTEGWRQRLERAEARQRGMNRAERRSKLGRAVTKRVERLRFYLARAEARERRRQS